MSKIRLYWKQFWEDRFESSNERFMSLMMEYLNPDLDDRNHTKRKLILLRQWIELRIEDLCMFCMYGREP